MDFEQLSVFIQERWFVIVIALIALFLIIKIVQTVMKWLLVLVIIAGLLFYGANYKEKLVEVGTEIVDTIKEQAIKAIENEAAEAQFEQHGDGTYTVSTKNLVLEGKVGSEEVKVTFKGQSFTFKMNDFFKAFIEESKKNPR